MNSAKNIARKWFDKLDFDKALCEKFPELLERAEINEEVNASNAILSREAGDTVTVTVLYLIDGMWREYQRRGLSEKLFYENVKGIKSRIENAFLKNGEFCPMDFEWNRKMLDGTLWSAGRLQFGLGSSPVDIPSKEVKKGDKVLQLHIPAGQKLGFEDCIASINRAISITEKSYPDFEYKYITILSWVLDNSVKDLLGEGSNVLKFATLFEIVANSKSDSIIRFVFGGGATREDLPGITPNGRFQTALKESALAGREFYCPRGVIDVEKWKMSDRFVRVEE